MRMGESVCGKVKELTHHDVPAQLENYVVTISYRDEHLCHSVITGRLVTGVLHMMNKSPMDWHSKEQSTVETATHVLENSSARTCAEQILDLRITLRFLGAPLREIICMFG